MAPHGNPEEPASAAGEIKREAPKVAATTAESTTAAPASAASVASSGAKNSSGAKEEHPWSLWEVFVRSSRGLSHVHAGSLHAPDAAMALRNARDLYTRRNEGVSIWVVPAEAISSSDPDSKGSFFESPQGKDYRHATYYTKSEGVKHL
ncbi:ring-1,2-phenylacetyl-CoA epoxidase subunit PaaB [Paenarthrobacter nicotinovorans]|uniref:1,2-phenylacetyl-CoA epoxidase subunit PaaB n=1 Tax=Paenarthrobacter nicotinovorans TaxID=29320 RepID=UPI002781001B|nr:1,2-phenylacetyl-CoA epoxidase subunit PaaB [Paenarthrobacter nicotinovorans]MDP9936265.1 ring-1,2-phenylacetyl-CoA epoxidase subunit PaaB [Paenarthrobacter nicotinovorans]